MNKTTIAIMAIGAVLCMALPAYAEVPGLINYQAYLTDPDGVHINDVLDMEFTLWDDAVSTDPLNLLWTETWDSGTDQVEVSDGYYSVLLGSYTSFGAVFEDNSALWLEVEVDAEVMTARKRVAAVAYALSAKSADEITFLITESHIEDGAVTAGKIAAGAVGSSQIAAGAVGSSQIADGTIAGADIGTDALGETEIQDIYVLNTGDVMTGKLKVTTEEGSSGVVEIGHLLNSATGDYAVAMGERSTASHNASTALGYNTTASEAVATAMGESTVASGHAATAMGGHIQANGDYSVAIGLGYNATPPVVTADNTMAIMGGNVGIGTVSPSATLDVAGDLNVSGTISGSGGNADTLDSLDSSQFMRSDADTGTNQNLTVGQKLVVSNSHVGPTAQIGYNCTATGDYSVAMGYSSDATHSFTTAIGNHSTAEWSGAIAIGNNARASNHNAMAIGSETTSQGSRSTAMGSYISVTGDHSFGIGLNYDLTPPVVSANNTMAIMGGNVGIGTVSPSAKLDVNGDLNVSGTIIGAISGNINANTLDSLDSTQFMRSDTSTATSGSLTANGVKVDGGGVLRFRDNPGGGGSDEAYLSYYPRSGESTTLDIVVNNDADDHIALRPTGNVGIGTNSPVQKLDVRGNTYVSGNTGLGTTNPGSHRLSVYGSAAGDSGTTIWTETNESGGTALYAKNSHTSSYKPTIKVENKGSTGRLIEGYGSSGQVFAVENSGQIWGNGNLWIGHIYATGLDVSGTKNFAIAHPLDPENRQLVHASVEGPEAAVFYRGEAQLVDGEAVVELPAYFEALTRAEGRTVQLTSLDGYSPLFVSERIKDGRFTVETTDFGDPAQAFYWEVKAVRADVEPVVVERPKKIHPGSTGHAPQVQIPN